MLDIKTLKDLIQLMKDNDLTEVNLQDEKETVALKRGNLNTVVNHQPVIYHGGGPAIGAMPAMAAMATAPMTMGATSAPATPAAPAAAAPPASAKAADADAGLIAIESPMVGTFYSAPNPDAKPFVVEGATINNSSVVCLIEAMKVYNEIKAEKSGTVAKVLVKNGQAVEFGTKLFLLKPE
jgi:acetyl-CoA carboxylase biotin carboxyl carrier protein